MLSAIFTNLKQRGSSKPRTMKTLSSTSSSLFQKELASLLAELQGKGLILTSDNKVSYALP